MCLFAASGLDLRGPLRAGATDEDIVALIRGTWSQRSDRYSEIRDTERAAAHPAQKVEMHYIGG